MKKDTLEYERALNAVADMLRETGRPFGGFSEPARRAPSERPGDDTESWVEEINRLTSRFSVR
ncbi:hypothetical protein [Streptomyces sp. NPDC000931]|uniref:hypothetical protein n=1 Tax=Streptomyces sp. NPDC000931 TaxID=3154372 RepID=UPI00331912CC